VRNDPTCWSAVTHRTRVIVSVLCFAAGILVTMTFWSSYPKPAVPAQIYRPLDPAPIATDRQAPRVHFQVRGQMIIGQDDPMAFPAVTWQVRTKRFKHHGDNTWARNLYRQ
jgi:hypothetical protein